MAGSVILSEAKNLVPLLPSRKRIHDGTAR